MAAQFPVERVELRPAGGGDGAGEAQVLAGRSKNACHRRGVEIRRMRSTTSRTACARASLAIPMILSGKAQGNSNRLSLVQTSALRASAKRSCIAPAYIGDGGIGSVEPQADGVDHAANDSRAGTASSASTG
jgi:hypothetical protein